MATVGLYCQRADHPLWAGQPAVQQLLVRQQQAVGSERRCQTASISLTFNDSRAPNEATSTGGVAILSGGVQYPLFCPTWRSLTDGRHLHSTEHTSLPTYDVKYGLWMML